METAITIYMLPMMLGRTFDMGKSLPGIQIFSQEEINKNITIENHFTDAQYRMVDNADDVRDFLDVGGKLSLKIKSGMLDVKGEGSYLKDSSSRANSLEILVKVRFETVTQTLPTNAKPVEDWTLEDKKYLGTHYCRSITFGGDLIASIRFTTTNTYDKERIKGAIHGGLKSGSSFEAEVNADDDRDLESKDLLIFAILFTIKHAEYNDFTEGELEKLKSDSLDSTSMEIKYYASVPIPGVSYTIQGLLDLVENFPTHVEKVNGGLGSPLKMELYPLNSIDSTFPTYIENKALNDQLDDLEEYFDDIKTTRREMGHWIDSLSPDMTDEVQKMISDFVRKLDTVQGSILKTVIDLDLSDEDASSQLFSDAFEAYADKGNRLPLKYYRQFEKLKKDIYARAPELRPKIGGASYVRWGSSECSNPDDTETTASGVLVTSDKLQNGGSSEFTCVPNTPQFIGPEQPEASSQHLKVSPLLYRGTLETFRDKYQKVIACSTCRSKEKTAAFVKMAATACPKNWAKEYEGILMAPAESESNKGQYICVDRNMSTVSDVLFGSVTDVNQVGEIREVFLSSGSTTYSSDNENFPIPCVVCLI